MDGIGRSRALDGAGIRQGGVGIHRFGGIRRSGSDPRHPRMSSRTRLAGPRTLRKLRMKSVAIISGTPLLFGAQVQRRSAR